MSKVKRTKLADRVLPIYTHGEEIFNMVSHIVGAVMGLIQVMSNMHEIEILAKGIATAFVATLYGVGFANLIFLPIAGNLKQRLREKVLLKEVILQGLISIQMQENPAIIEEKLLSYIKYHNKNHSLEVQRYI